MTDILPFIQFCSAWPYSYFDKPNVKMGQRRVFIQLDEDREKGICPTIVQIDYFGMIVGRICFLFSFFNEAVFQVLSE